MKKYIASFVILYPSLFSHSAVSHHEYSVTRMTPATTQDGVVFINKRKSDEYLIETSGRAMSSKVYKTTGNQKILWTTEDAGGGFVRLKNVGNGKYLHCENGRLQVSDIEDGWQSAMWKITVDDGYVSIQNKFTRQFINNQNDELGLSVPKNKAWNSALWKMRAP